MQELEDYNDSVDVLKELYASVPLVGRKLVNIQRRGFHSINIEDNFDRNNVKFRHAIGNKKNLHPAVEHVQAIFLDAELIKKNHCWVCGVFTEKMYKILYCEECAKDFEEDKAVLCNKKVRKVQKVSK